MSYAATTDDLTADEVRSAVIDYMHHGGENRWRLHDCQWRTLYFMANGYGKVTVKFAEEQCWDWSHVRDSDDDTFRLMWTAICDWHNRCLLKSAK